MSTRRTSSASTSRATSSRSYWSPRPATSQRSTTSPSCWIPAPTAPTSPCVRWRAAWRSKRWLATKPDWLAKVPVDRRHRVSIWLSRAPSPSRVTCRPRCSTRPRSPSKSCGSSSSSPRTPPWWRSTRWCAPPTIRILALDGKVTLDGNADFRQPGHAEFEDRDATDPLELKAKEHDLNYVKLDGEVGIIGNGAGLVMSTLDVVAYAGEKPRGSQAGQLPRHRGGARRPRWWPPGWT